VITIMSIHGIIRDIYPGKPRTDVKARLSNRDHRVKTLWSHGSGMIRVKES